jgi:hypothetical protein
MMLTACVLAGTGKSLSTLWVDDSSMQGLQLLSKPMPDSPTRHCEVGQGARYPYGSVKQSGPDCIQPGRRSVGLGASPPDHTCAQQPPGRLFVVQLAPGHMLRSGAVARLTCGSQEVSSMYRMLVWLKLFASQMQTTSV